MAGWHHQLIGHESEQIPGYSEGQGSLECCSLWGCKESEMIQQLSHKNSMSANGYNKKSNLCCIYSLIPSPT